MSSAPPRACAGLFLVGLGSASSEWSGCDRSRALGAARLFRRCRVSPTRRPSRVLSEDHKRQFEPLLEKQASFISGELLIPDEAARKAAYADWDNARVAEKFNVSEQFAQMRMSGPRVIARRAAQRYGFGRR